MIKMSKESAKEKIVLRRLEQVYCRLAPSPIHGCLRINAKIPSALNC